MSETLCQPFGLELFRIVGGPAALPHDGAVDRLGRCAVPDNGRLALVGDTDCGDIFRSRACPDHCFLGDEILGGPDLIRIMFDPARMGVMLCEFFLGYAAHLTFFIE